MKKLFAVIRSRGPAWQSSLPLEKQEAWEVHAEFMDALRDEGFIVVGGPLEGTWDVLHIIRAENEDEIIRLLQEDPWSSIDLLRTTRISPWTLRLGSLP